MAYWGLRWLRICLQCRRPRFDPWKIPWRRAWQPTPVFLPGESHGQRSLVGYSPWGHKDLDTTERKTIQHNCSPPLGQDFLNSLNYEVFSLVCRNGYCEHLLLFLLTHQMFFLCPFNFPHIYMYHQHPAECSRKTFLQIFRVLSLCRPLVFQTLSCKF